MGNRIMSNIDATSKLMLILFTVLVSYIIALAFVKPLFTSLPMGDAMLNFSEQNLRVANFISLIIGIGFGFLVSVYISIGLRDGTDPDAASRPSIGRQDEIEILKRAISKDEALVLGEVEMAGKITQDSLRFRLNWSKAKVSAVVTNLERLGIVQRERSGKTYSVFVPSRENQGRMKIS